MVYLLVFIFGTIIGSFLNVVILRYNSGESIIFSGSRCFSCARKLKWHELIPIFSFLIQRGRCQHCRSKISLQYPLVETITGIIFILLFRQSQISNLKSQNFWILDFGFWAFTFSLLIIIAVYDFRHQIIPDKFIYTFDILAFLNLFRLPTEALAKAGISNFEFRISTVWPSFLAGIAFFAFFALLWLISRGHWMGFGDAKLALGIGWLLGPVNGFIAILLSFWIGALISIFLLLFRRKTFTLESKIPFGPFLVLGTLIAFLFSEEILKIYFNIF